MKSRTIQYINTHLLNRSKTKQAHSFSKSPRFKTVSPVYGEYNLSHSAVHLTNRSSGVVFPKQSRFLYNRRQFKRQNSPSPQSYKSPSFFEQSIKKKKGMSFAHTQKLRSPKNQHQPGPGQYQISKYNRQHIFGFTMSKQQSSIRAHWNKIGPGQYNNDSPLTKSSKNIVFGQEKRFKPAINPSNHNPGPGQHSHQMSLAEQSKIYKKPPIFSFTKSNRQSAFNSKRSTSPGPGCYDVGFSEFSERTQRIYNILNRL